MASIRQSVFASGSGHVISWAWDKPTKVGNILLAFITTDAEPVVGAQEGLGTPSQPDLWQPTDGSGHIVIHAGGPGYSAPGFAAAWDYSAEVHSGTESFTVQDAVGGGDTPFLSWHIAVFEMRHEQTNQYQTNADTAGTAASFAAGDPVAFSAQSSYDGNGFSPVYPAAPGYELAVLVSPMDDYAYLDTPAPTFGAPSNGFAELAQWVELSGAALHEERVGVYGREVGASGDDIYTEVVVSGFHTYVFFSWAFWSPTAPTESWDVDPASAAFASERPAFHHAESHAADGDDPLTGPDGVTELPELDDVRDDADTLTDRIILTWDDDAGEWVPTPPSLDGDPGPGGLLFVSGIDGDELIIDGGS